MSDQFTREHRSEIALAASAGVGAPLLMRQLTAAAGVRITDEQRTSIAEAYGQARQAALSLQVGDALAVTRAFTESEAFQNLTRSGDEYARGFQATLQDATRSEEQWQSALARERALEETYQRLQRWSESVDGDFTQGFVQHLRNETVTGERWLEDRLRAGDSGAIMRVAAIWAAGEDVAGAIKPASLLTREDVRPRPLDDTRDEVERRLDGGAGAVSAEHERMRSTAERSARAPNEHFDENSELVETQGSVLDLADRNGLPAAATDRGVERRVEGAERDSSERLQDAREAREYQEDLLETRHDFATRHGAARTTFTHGSVGGDATEGLPAVDQSVTGEPVVPSRRMPADPGGSRGREDSADYLDHEKLSRLIPGYVRPDETNADD